MNCCDSASHPWDRWHVEQRWMPHPLRTPHCQTRGHRRSRLSVPAGGTCFFAFLPAASAMMSFPIDALHRDGLRWHSAEFHEGQIECVLSAGVVGAYQEPYLQAVDSAWPLVGVVPSKR
jgi:hypothetical protein